MRALPLPFPVLDADASAGASAPGDFGALPEWDLTDLYAAPDAPEVARDLDKLGKACAAFARSTRASSPRSTPTACWPACAPTKRSTPSPGG
jgi:hypothetical protein